MNKDFIRLLTTTITEHSLHPSLKLNEEAFKKNLNILKHYVEDNEEKSLEVLFGVQTLGDRLEYPLGMCALNKIYLCKYDGTERNPSIRIIRFLCSKIFRKSYQINLLQM